MAFVKSVVLSTGITLDEAYIRVEDVSLDTKRDKLYCAFNLYASEQARLDGKDRIETYYRLHIPCDKTGNLVQQAYEYVNVQLASGGDSEVTRLFDGVVSV